MGYTIYLQFGTCYEHFIIKLGTHDVNITIPKHQRLESEALFVYSRDKITPEVDVFEPCL